MPKSMRFIIILQFSNIIFVLFFFQHQIIFSSYLSLSKHLLKTSTSAEMDPDDRKRRQDRNSSRATRGCGLTLTSKAQTSRTPSVRGRGRPKNSCAGMTKSRPPSKKPARGRPRGSRVNKTRNKSTATRRTPSKKPARGRPKGSRVSKARNKSTATRRTPSKKAAKDTGVRVPSSDSDSEPKKKTDSASNRESQAKKAEEDNSSENEPSTQSGTESARTDDSAPLQ